MEWKSFFKLRVMREEDRGSIPYFEADLKVPDQFSLEDLNIKHFEQWNLTPQELKSLTLAQKKILLRHYYFNSKEFERICDNFQSRLKSEKERELRFSTKGGGIYLFIAILKDRSLRERKIHCQTSEIPLPIIKLPTWHEQGLSLTYRPEFISVFDRLPSLWHNSPLLQLFEVDQIDSEVA